MRIALPTIENKISGHFGHCPLFTIYEVNEGKISNKKIIENPGHEKVKVPVYLKELNIDVVIAGNMGEGAQKLLKENNMEVILGANGVCDEIVDKYLKGELKSVASTCHGHDGHHGENGHQCKCRCHN
ncbi:NifB/NifX family molybdenum-iron cluster-binding protein [Clostridium lundense]|uniref:NifB/NifX family molybdenum-iron cluster-binding protein n=1 Tax=Clostridium lundense TaxID=319475 RepID=UPI0006874AE7|nr:NifB/NifX family molybdenum-iron cluster-binding protein [Clostridium lundense]